MRTLFDADSFDDEGDYIKLSSTHVGLHNIVFDYLRDNYPETFSEYLATQVACELSDNIMNFLDEET